MLTATYSLVVIAAEHDSARGMLRRLRQYIQTTWSGLNNIDFAFLENALGKLMQFDKYCRTRKIEVYLIPFLRKAGREVEGLVAELNALSAQGQSILRLIGEQLDGAFDLSRTKVNELCHAMEAYCNYWMARLEKEEEQLLPMARRLLSIDDWFAIAAQFLSDDAGGNGSKRHKPAPSRSVAKNRTSNANLR
ncbi:MAG TPA: hypothetical protein VM571_10200 [Noviherbaspirillum sp.]|jgi:hemerythrin-like domain-containing protein|nr:hypothetical protein [Noviherbaspirillum sp.]